MVASLTFDRQAEIDDETVSMKELRDFLESPQSIGLADVKQSLRNVVLLMLELKGHPTGFMLHNLTHDTHTSMALEGGLQGDRKKARKVREFWDEYMKLERLMARQFAAIFAHVSTKVAVIKASVEQGLDRLETVEDQIDEEIEAIDQEIKRQKDDPTGSTAAKEFKKRKIEQAKEIKEAKLAQKREIKAQKKEYARFQKRVEQQEQKLGEAAEAEDASAVLEVEKEITRTAEAFEATETIPEPDPNPLGPLGDVMRNERERAEFEASFDSESKPPSQKSSRASRDSDKGSSDDDSSGGDDGAQATEPDDNDLGL